MTPASAAKTGEPVGDNIWARLATRLVNDRRLLVLIIGVVAVAGLSSISVLPRMEDPVLRQRVAMINTLLPGADASRVEALITEKLEDSLRDIREIKEIRSLSRPGISSITIELLDAITETDVVWAKVRGKMEDTLPQLPAGATRPEFEELEVRAYARIVSLVWTADGEVDYAVLRRTAKQLQDRLQELAGTEAVDRYGDPGEEITVQVEPTRAAAIGLSIAAIADQLRAADAKQAAGQLRGAEHDLSLSVDNEFRDLAEVSRTNIRSSAGSFVRLDQVAQVSLAPQTPLPRWARHGDQVAISLGALIRPAARIDRWSTGADALLAEFSTRLPAGVGLIEVMNQADYVTARLSSLTTNLAVGAAAVCVVILLLMGWRSAIVVALALPLTVLTVLFGMRLWDIPVHQMSITGLIIALGLLIDNAIVIADEVRTELAAGLSPTEAVRQSVSKLAVPLWGSTLTTALAFAPIALMPGPAGEFVSSIAFNVIMAIGASLVFSLTVIAALAAIWLRVAPSAATSSGQRETIWRTVWQQGFRSDRLLTWYRTTLRFLLRRPWLALAASLVLPLAGFSVAPLLAEQFFPPADRDQFYLEVELAQGASIADTDRVARRLDALLREEPVEQVDWYFGDSAPTFYYNVIASQQGRPGFGQAIIRVPAEVSVSDIIRRLQRTVDREILDARVLVRQLEQGPPFNAPVEVRLFGPDLEKLQAYGEQLRNLLVNVPRTTHTTSLVSETLPKIALDVDPEAARIAGLTATEIAAQVQAAYDGLFAGNVLQETEELPVRIRFADAQRADLASLETLDLVSRGPQGEPALVPVKAVAKLRLVPETGVIVRLNRRRMNEVSGYLVAGTLPSEALGAFKQKLADAGWRTPPGYALEYGGEASKRNDAVGNLLASVGVLMAMMVTTLVLSFGSFRLASVIGAVGCLSIGLGMGALWIGGYPFGFMAIIGAMGLIGIAINDSIVVLATLQANHGQQQLDVEEVVDSVSSCTRHVLATTFTTIAGFSPLIWSGGEFWPPLAVAIAGGVTGASVLALVFVPAAYQLAYCPRIGSAASGERAAGDFQQPVERKQPALTA